MCVCGGGGQLWPKSYQALYLLNNEDVILIFHCSHFPSYKEVGVIVKNTIFIVLLYIVQSL